MDYQRSTEQQSLNRYDQVQRTSTSLSDRSTAPYSSSRRQIEQRPTGRYGQDQRPTEDSSRSQSSDYSSQRRPTGQQSANQYGQRPSSNSSNQSDRRSELYATSRRPVEQRPADRHGQYQRPMQEGNQRPSAQQSVNPSAGNASAYSPSRRPVEQCPDDRYGQYQRPVQEGNPRQTAQQSVNPSDRNASAYSASRIPAEQRPVDRQGQYRQSAQELRPRLATQSNKSSVSNPDSKKIPEKHTVEPHEKYTSDQKQRRKFPVKSVIIGVAALLVFSVFAVIRIKRDGGISLPTGVPGEAEATYNYIDDDQIIKKDLIGSELIYDGDCIASGTIKYKFKNVTTYDNVYMLCGEELKNDIDNPSLFKLDRDTLSYSYTSDSGKVYRGYTKQDKDANGTIGYHYEYPDVFDITTGILKNNCHIFVFEIELTNIDARSDVDNYYIKSYNEFRISGMFYLLNRSGETPYYGKLCYFAEAPDSDNENTNLSYHLVISPGETKTIHLGYFLPEDESEHPYSRMGLADEGHTSTYDDNTVFLWFDMSDMISKEKE